MYCALSLVISDTFFKVVMLQCIYMHICNFFEKSVWYCVVTRSGFVYSVHKECRFENVEIVLAFLLVWRSY